MTQSSIVLFETDARGVATVTLNRPEVHNALNGDVLHRLSAIFEEIAGRSDIRIVVLRGNGKSFCAGGDLDWMKKSGQNSYEQNFAETMVLAKLFKILNELPQATLALVQGNCMAGATGMVSCCDIVVATEETRFALTEVRIGLSPATISPYVVAAMGPRQARRYFLTGERFTAVEAARIGLVHQAVPDMAALEKRGAEVIRDLLSAAPGAVKESKWLIRQVTGHHAPDEEIMRLTAKNIADRRASAEGQEGLASFFEKRKPNWVKE